FGIATEITVRLEPIPAAVRTLLADFSSVRSASEAVSAIIASGVGPAALEMMDQACGQAVEASIYAAGYPTDAAAVLLAEVDGSPEQVEAEAALVEGGLRSHGARGRGRASSAADRARLWQGRKKAFGAMGRVAPDLVVQDAGVPRSALPDVLNRMKQIRDLYLRDRINEIRALYRLRISNVFHAGDGNLHPNISFDRGNHSEAERVRDAS